jgi:hypothetical protein
VLLVAGAYSAHIVERQYFINMTNFWDAVYAPSLALGVTPSPGVYMRTPFADFPSCVWFTIVTACSGARWSEIGPIISPSKLGKNVPQTVIRVHHTPLTRH